MACCKPGECRFTPPCDGSLLRCQHTRVFSDNDQDEAYLLEDDDGNTWLWVLPLIVVQLVVVALLIVGVVLALAW